MSLYKFIESSIEENPDITMINFNSGLTYIDIYKYYQKQVKQYYS
jgi:hypothetical protein